MSSLYLCGSIDIGGGGLAGRCAGIPHLAILELGLGGVGSGCDSGWLVEAIVMLLALLDVMFGAVVAGGSETGSECG